MFFFLVMIFGSLTTYMFFCIKNNEKIRDFAVQNKLSFAVLALIIIIIIFLIRWNLKMAALDENLQVCEIRRCKFHFSIMPERAKEDRLPKVSELLKE